MPMLTWSSWPAEDVIESTAAGCARLFISDTSDAAVYWHAMNPELTPASPTRNAGRPFEVVRVEEPEEPALGDRSEPHGRRGQRVAGERYRLAVEVPAGEDLTGLGQHDGIVGDRGQLDLEGLRAVANHVAESSVHLGGTADRVRVLNDVVALAVRRKDLAACQESHQVPSRRQLARMRAEAHDPGVEGTVGTEDGFDGERGRDVRDLGEPACSPSRQHSDGGHTLRAVDEGETFLGFQHQRFEATPTKGLDGREPLALQPNLTFADHGKGEMCERREVTRSAERPLLGHDGEDVPLEHFHEPQHDVASDPRVAERQDVRSQRQHGADLLGRELVPDRHRM